MATANDQQREAWPFRWLRNGTFGAWFAWIEWLGLTAALITGALKADGTLLKLPIGILAALSVLFAFFSGLAGLSSFFGSLLARLRLPAPLHFPAAVVVSILITGGVLWSLVSVFLALLPGGA